MTHPLPHRWLWGDCFCCKHPCGGVELKASISNEWGLGMPSTPYGRGGAEGEQSFRIHSFPFPAFRLIALPGFSRFFCLFAGSLIFSYKKRKETNLVIDACVALNDPSLSATQVQRNWQVDKIWHTSHGPVNLVHRVKAQIRQNFSCIWYSSDCSGNINS